MKRLQTIKRYLLIALVPVFFGCSEDLGNYNYTELEAVKIEGISSEIVKPSFDPLILNVTIEGLSTNESNYTYEWKAIDQGTKKTETVLADTKNLNMVLDLPVGNYKLIYTVTNTLTRVYTRVISDLRLTNATSEGWVVLCSDNNRVRLDMISTIDDKFHSKDILATTNNPYTNGPRAIEALIGAAPNDSPYYLLTDDGTTRLGQESFEWKPEFDLKYEMGYAGSTPKPYAIASCMTARYMVNGTSLQASTYNMGAMFWGKEMNFLKVNGNKQPINVAPYIGGLIGSQMSPYFTPSFLFFDSDNKQLVACYSGDPMMLGMFGYDSDLFVLTDGGTEGNAFSFPKGHDLLTIQSSSYDPNIGVGLTYAVLKSGESIAAYGIAMGDPFAEMFTGISLPITKYSFTDLSACEGIMQADHFAFSSLHPQMFYAVGGKVYRVDLNTANPTANEMFEVNGEKISCLKFDIYNKEMGSKQPYDLIIGTEQGTLRIYDTTNPTAQITTARESYTGFAKIVDVIYKK